MNLSDKGYITKHIPFYPNVFKKYKLPLIKYMFLVNIEWCIYNFSLLNIYRNITKPSDLNYETCAL